MIHKKPRITRQLVLIFLNRSICSCMLTSILWIPTVDRETESDIWILPPALRIPVLFRNFFLSFFQYISKQI